MVASTARSVAQALDLASFTQAPPALVREMFPPWMDIYLDAPPVVRSSFASALRAVLAETPDADVSAMLAAFGTAGAEYRLYPADPLARRMSRSSMVTLLTDAKLEGLSHLRAAAAIGPCLLVCNHLSYADTQITDVLLARKGAEDLADALVAVAGPKVYDTFFRRIATICLSTIKTAQSSGVAQNDSHLSPREVGRIALGTVRQTEELMAAGHLPLLYAEGSRSRSGRLQPFLRAVTRYCAVPGIRIVPTAISGTNVLLPLPARAMRPAAVRLAFGESVRPEANGSRQALEETWHRIAALLPEAQRPDRGTPAIA